MWDPSKAEWVFCCCSSRIPGGASRLDAAVVLQFLMAVVLQRSGERNNTAKLCPQLQLVAAKDGLLGPWGPSRIRLT